MNRKFLAMAAAAVALPAMALAAPQGPAARIVIVPVALAPMPVRIVMPAMPVGLIRQVAAMQASMDRQMAALERLAFAPTRMPLEAVPGGMTQVSMVSVGGPGGVCSEQMRIIPGKDGQMHVFVRRSGNGCAPLPAALGHGAPGARMAPAPTHMHRPPNALPPPSKLIEADFAVPGKARRAG